jgi:hypothetical protein
VRTPFTRWVSDRRGLGVGRHANHALRYSENQSFDSAPSPVHRSCEPPFHGTLNAALALRVAPSAVQVTVCVPVPGVVLEALV